MEFQSLVTLEGIQEALLKTSVKDLPLKIQEKCVAICNKYSLTPVELMQTLEAFLIETNKETLEMDAIGKFEQAIKDYQHKQQKISQRNNQEVKIESRKREMAQVTSSSSSSNSPMKRIATSPLRYDSDSTQVLSQDSVGGTGGENFLNRENSGQVVVKFNENLPQRGTFQRSSSLPLGRRCLMQLDNLSDFSNVPKKYRYMFTPLEERAKAIETHLLTVQEEMMKFVNLTEISPLGAPSQSTVWVCGRVCKDAEEGKINSTSIILQGSRLESSGKRVNLNMTDISQYSLFPGQIILVEGHNPSGREFYAKRIIEGLPRPLPKTSPEKLLEYHHSNYYQNGTGLKVFIASGPFTTSDNLNYHPLDQLIRTILDQKPDLVLFIGPFVDSSQPLIQQADRQLYELNEDGGVVYGTEHNATNEMIFIEKFFRDGLVPYFNAEDNLPTNFVLIPSLQDAHHDCVFPQPPFENSMNIVTIEERQKIFEDIRHVQTAEIPYSRDKDSLKRVYLASNPCMFRCNEILFGITSIDPLFALSADEVSVNAGHRMTRMAGHILQQQSFYPSFPAPNNSLAPLDLRHSRHWEMQVTSPDVLIVPSKLAPLVTDVFGTLVINPGQVAKGTNGGTYANMTINPIEEMSLRKSIQDNQTEIPHNVSNRSNVAIIRV